MHVVAMTRHENSIDSFTPSICIIIHTLIQITLFTSVDRMLFSALRLCHHRPLLVGNSTPRMPQKSITSFFEVTQKRKAAGNAEERMSKRTTVLPHH